MPRCEPRSIKRLMFMETSRRRSPSTANFAICERSALTSISVRSFTLVRGSTPAPSQAMRARAGPTPYICVSPTQTCLFIGILIPAMRAILLPLPLLVARLRADHIDHALATHDLAVLADLFDRRSYFHRVLMGPGPRCFTCLVRRGRSRADSPSSEVLDTDATSCAPAAAT